MRNRGKGPSGPATLHYYRSVDSTNTSDDTEVGTVQITGLNASGSAEESVLSQTPTTPSTYYYDACVDPVTGESDTANNCSQPVAVTVLPPPPDLVVGAATVRSVLDL